MKDMFLTMRLSQKKWASSFLVLTALALLQPASEVWAQTSLANALDATNLVWTTGGTGEAGWTYEAQGPLGGDITFDGIASVRTGDIGDNGETWLETTVVGPGTVSFWWKAYSEPDADWLEFYIDSAMQARICGGGDDRSSWATDWEYCSFPVPAGTNVLKWRYSKDYSLTGGTLDCAWVDRVSYVTSPPPPLAQALNTSGVLWSSSGSAYANGWFAQSNTTHDGQWAAQSGAVWHNQTNWLQATVSGLTNVSFWWQVSSESYDFLEFYINGVLASQISGQVSWQHLYFQLPAATNVLTWAYRRDASSTAGSNCGWLDQVAFNTTVNRAGTSTSLTGSGKASVFGQPVTFTAKVTATAPGSGTPTGMVTFKDGATILGTSSLSAGSTTFSTTALSAASHSITATYGGDGSFTGSTSSAASQVVSQSSSTTILTASANSSVFGQPVTFTAKVSAVAPGNGTAGGMVTFKDGTTTLGTAMLSSGQASLTSSSMSVGSHSISAVYGGEASFKTSSSTTIKHPVNKAGSSTTVTAAVNPSRFGQAVTFTATVNPVAPSSGTPTGTVQFKVNGVNSGSAVTLTGGSASSPPVSNLAAEKATTITAVYNGDTRFNSSTSSALTQTVIKANSTTALASSTSTSVFGQRVILTATVTAEGGGTPMGTVTFKDGAVVLSSSTLNGGQARCTNSTLSLGSHSFTAVFVGNTGFNGSDTTTSPLTLTVGQASTTTTVTSSANPSVLGQSVTFTATVGAMAPGAGTPTGTVQFSIDGSAWGLPVSLSGSKASSSSISSLALAGHTVTASFNGDSNFTGSDNTASPLTQIVNKPSPTITITSSKNPASVGDPVTWTARVSAAAPGAITPSGTIQFKIDGIDFDGLVTLAGGNATSLVMATLAPGSHTITSVYSGDANFNGSTSANFTQTVNTSPVTPATGGGAISADTAAGDYTLLNGPAYAEAKVGAVGAGTIILKAPAGFEFDTAGVMPTVRITGSTTSANNINDAVSGTALPMTSVSPTQLTFTVTAASTSKNSTPNTMTWQNVRVRPTARTPLASGIIVKTGTATLNGVTTTTSFGFLAETAGAASGLTSATSGEMVVSTAASDPLVHEGAVGVTVESANIPLIIQSLRQQPDLSMELRASGVPGQTYLIQASENLGSWTTIGSNDTDANGIIVFVDRNAMDYSSRFYRIMKEVVARTGIEPVFQP